MRSLAVSFPKTVRPNSYWAEHHPEMVQGKRDATLSRVWSAPASDAPDIWTQEMLPYVDDPFRGTKERRWLEPDETVTSMELDAALQALRAAGLDAGQVDLLIASAFLPESVGVGSAAFLAKALGLRGAAWNLETACSSALVAFETACALVRAGTYQRVLVVVSCAYSRVVDDTDTLAWSIGDGATAFVVSHVPSGEGLLGSKTVHTGETCGAMFYELVQGTTAPVIRMRASESAARALRETAQRALTECCTTAVKQVGLTLNDIDFFAVTTPMAWYSTFCQRTLGFDAKKTFNVHPRYANVGPVLMPANLFHAAHEGKVRPGQVVLLHTVGSVSSASAAVVRWGEVGLGSAP
ncbi:MAG: hypothetical protein JNG84_10765 [Archangium sp.]|nr:hypothetical protein [Archangium sp.]